MGTIWNNWQSDWVGEPVTTVEEPAPVSQGASGGQQSAPIFNTAVVGAAIPLVVESVVSPAPRIATLGRTIDRFEARFSMMR